jgi:Ring finger domain
MDIAFYFENSYSTTRRAMSDEFKFIPSLIIRVLDVSIGCMFLTFLYGFRHSLAHKTGNKVECMEYLNLLEGLTWVILASDVAFGNFIDLVLFESPIKKYQLIFNICVAILGGMISLKSDDNICHEFFKPQDQRLTIEHFMIYVAAVHICPILAIVVWLFFLNHARWVQGQPMSLRLGYWSLLTQNSNVTVINSNPRMLPDLTVYQGPVRECPICFSDVKTEEEIRPLPCAHVYHKECLDTWLLLGKDNGCPICRSAV